MTLDTWLKSRSDRCPGCGFHVAAQGCRCATSEWDTFLAALRTSVREDGTIHQGDVRPLIRGRIAPKTIGTLYRKARDSRLIRDTGEREPSTDVAGRNTDKTSRVYAVGERWAA